MAYFFFFCLQMRSLTRSNTSDAEYRTSDLAAAASASSSLISIHFESFSIVFIERFPFYFYYILTILLYKDTSKTASLRILWQPPVFPQAPVPLHLRIASYCRSYFPYPQKVHETLSTAVLTVYAFVSRSTINAMSAPPS